jgi:hypothetical protein
MPTQITRSHRQLSSSPETSLHAARVLGTTLAVLMLLAPDRARAEDTEAPRPRQGYYVTVGGVGLVNVSREKQAVLSPIFGGGGSLRLGELITPSLGLGIVLDGGAGKGSDKSTLGGLSFDAHYLVGDLVALHAGVGLGVSSLKDAADTKAKSRGGLGTYYTLGASYDWFLTDIAQSGGWSLSPMAELRLVDAGKVETGLFFVGLQVSFWSGLDKSRLALDDEAAYGKE